MSNFKTYTKAILIPLIVGGVVGLIISNSMDYGALEKPFLAPPRMAISNYLDNTLCFNGSILWNIKC